MMESLLAFLEPLTRLICTAVVIFLFFLFIVRPLLNYLIVNREIERRKKMNEELMPVDSLIDEVAGNESGEEEEKKASRTASQGLRASDKETLSRLATSDPDKAGDLIKKWVNND